jgi:microcystin degradation protein MlrC
MLKQPGTKHLKLNCDMLLSSFAFKFNLRRYILVTARDGSDAAARAAARAAAAELAAAAWALRDRFDVSLTPLREAVAAAPATGRPGAPVVLCDCGDNPGSAVQVEPIRPTSKALENEV